MRKWIIDTDTGSDDAVAILMALLSPEVEVLAMTTVSGNVSLEKATANCLMTAQVAGVSVPVYEGAKCPLVRSPVHAANVHGQDGMGDMDLIHPTTAAISHIHACDAILQLVKENPNEIELAVIGPATNIALAILKDRETMSLVKSIWTMGTAGFGRGNTTPVAEFNVYADAEAYKVMMEAGIPVHVVGFDMCLGDAAWDREEMERIRSFGPVGHFAVACNDALLRYNLHRSGEYKVDLPDAVAIGCMLWEDTVLEASPCISHVCVGDEVTYGQVVFYDGSALSELDGFGVSFGGKTAPDCTVVRRFDHRLYKARLEALLAGN